MHQLRLGVLGVGRMGQRHCRVCSGLRNVQFVGVYDTNTTLGQQVAQQYGVRYYAQLGELLEHVDAVCIATPTPSHFGLAKRCIERGIHLLIEKPISETQEQAAMLCQAAKDRGVIIQVGHIERFNPAYTELKNVLECMTPLAISMRRLSPYQGSNTDVDVVVDLMIHDLDLALDLVQRDPLAMTAHGITVYQGVVDHATASLDLGVSPLVTLVASRVTEQKVRMIEVTALEAYLECDLLNKSISVYRHTIGEYLNHNHRGTKYRQESIVECIHVPTVEPLLLELEHFVSCALEFKTPRVSAEDGARALCLALEIRDLIGERMVDARKELLPPVQTLAVGI